MVRLLDRILDSKTYSLLILVSLIAFATCVVAAIFGEMLWAKYIDFLTIQSGFGGARGIANDGVPKMIDAIKGNDSSKPLEGPPLPDPKNFPPLG